MSRARIHRVLAPACLGLLALSCLLVLCGVSAAAQAAETVALHTSFTPDRLGASTTIGFGFTIGSTTGGLPSPLTHVSLRMPKGMNYVTTTLGLAICQPEALVAKRASAGCPANSRLGYGSAFVEVPFGEGAGREIPEIKALMGPPHEGNIVVLFYANGLAPVYAQIVFSGELLPGEGAFGGSLDTHDPADHRASPTVRRCRSSTSNRRSAPNISPTTSASTENWWATNRRASRLPTNVPEGRLPVLRAVHVPRRQPGGGDAQRALPAADARHKK